MLKYSNALTQVKPNIKHKVSSEADEDSDYSDVGVRMYNDTKVMNNVDAYLDEPIRALGHYRNVFQYMRQMEEWDNLNLWLTSPGGYCNTAIEFANSMQQAKGTVKVHLIGENASAATLIALSAPQLIVGDRCTMMFHAASYGAYGKMDNVASKVLFWDEELRAFMWECYEGFLTEDEFAAMIDGKDFYMNRSEIVDRLEKRHEYQQQQTQVATECVVATLTNDSK